MRLELGAFAGGAFPMQEPKFSAGPSYGATVLLRPIWWTSIGLTIQKASYGYHAVGFNFDEPNGSYESTAKGLAWRLYLTDEGWFEPYFQAFLGSASVEVSDASPQCDGGGGGMTEFGLGIDAYTWSWVRLGASFGVSTGPPGSSECTLASHSGEPPAVPSGPLTANLRGNLTFVLGGPSRGLF
jgi:hypothetical protein